MITAMKICKIGPCETSIQSQMCHGLKNKMRKFMADGHPNSSRDCIYIYKVKQVHYIVYNNCMPDFLIVAEIIGCHNYLHMPHLSSPTSSNSNLRSLHRFLLPAAEWHFFQGVSVEIAANRPDQKGSQRPGQILLQQLVNGIFGRLGHYRIPELQNREV